MHHRHRPLLRTLAVLVSLIVLASACSRSDGDDQNSSGNPGDSTSSSGTSGAVGVELVTMASNTDPFDIRLSAGAADDGEAAAAAVVAGDPLPQDRVDALVDRLPPLEAEVTDRTDFNRPTESLPPPRAGDTVDVPFGEAGDGGDDAPETADGPLEVLRFQPQGSVDVAPFVSITFNQPMVPLTTLGQLSATDVPVSISPETPGRWDWIGTRTLRFEHQSANLDRLPASTTYTVEIPAGTTSETGGTLSDAVQFEFTTPTVQVRDIHPREDRPLVLDQVFVASFDQRVDPAAILRSTTLEVGGRDVEIRQATDDEIAEDKDIERVTSSLLADRWVAFRPVEPMPSASPVTITVGPELASLEGANTDSEVVTRKMTTFENLQVTQARCGWGDRCQPYAPLTIEFNNPLDMEAFDPAWVSVEPAIPGMRVRAEWTAIVVSGATAGDTTYEVTVAPTLVDVFGQTLGEGITESFKIGDADPRIGHPGRQLITLDPLAGLPALSVGSINHDSFDVVAYAVGPDDWADYIAYQRSREDTRGKPSFREVWSDRVDTEAKKNVFSETSIDLSDALEGGIGHLVVHVSPTGDLADLNNNDERFWSNRPFAVWVQATDLGVDVLADREELVVRVTSLADGSPVDGVTVDLKGKRATTDGDGLASLDSLTQSNEDIDRHTLSASRGDDVALMPADWSWQNWGAQDELRWYVFDDRGIYQPNETVHIKGWLREMPGSRDAQLATPSGLQSINYQVFGPQGNEVASGSTDATSLGGFDLEFDIPDGTNLGWAQVMLTPSGRSNGEQGFHQFQIQEFRRPEFEVTARAESPGPYLVGTPATVAVEAAYFAGGGLADAPVEWNVTKQTTTYRPPNHDDFNFGIWVPWWFRNDGFASEGGGFRGGGDFDEPGFGGPGFGDDGDSERFSGVTDAAGEHFLQMDFSGTDDFQPVSVTAAASVTDVNRQQWSSSTGLLVHPGELYVGLRSDRTFVRKGDDLTIEAIVVDIDGELIDGHEVVIEAGLVDYSWSDGQWSEIITDVQTCTASTSTDPATCDFDTTTGGQYRISAMVLDDEGRRNRSEITRWISGGRNRIPMRNVELEQALLIPDGESYEPGDTAQILVQAPFADAHGLLTLSRNGHVETETFVVDGDSTVIDIPIDDSYIPNINVQIDLTGATERTDDLGNPLPDVPERPAFASGSLNLPVSVATRTLTVEAAPADDRVSPGDDTSLAISVTDDRGTPVAGAELAVVVVDEAILALSNYDLADPLDLFYRDLPSLVNTTWGRQLVRLVDPQELVEQQGSGGASPTTTIATTRASGGDEESAMESDDAMADFDGDSAGAMADAPAAPQAKRAGENADGGPPGEPIDVRTNFDPLAVFAPDVTTDAAGSARVDVPLPDNLTRYRVMVVAVEGDDRFGSGESNITARLPLMVRPSAPLFLNFGDEFELPVVLQNQTDTELEVDVAIRATNLSLSGDSTNDAASGALTQSAGRRVTVPADDRIEVRFPARAADAGTARFQVVATSGAFSDAETRTLPVYTPATTEAFATYGVVDAGATSQTIVAPENVYPQFGGLEITTSSTAVQALTDAVLYLNEYRYRSSDSLASRILAISALRDVLDAFDAEGLPPAAEIEATVRSDIDDLVAMQNDDGGFPFWRLGRPSQPYNTIQAAHALTLAKQNGFAVPAGALQRALTYLADIESHFEPTYGQQTKDTLSAYALHVRDLADDRDAAKAGQLWSRRGDELGLEAIAWIWPVLDDGAADAEIERLFNNRATEEAATATFATDYGEDAYVVLHSNRRTDGLILDALISERPNSDLIPKVVAGLLDNQTRGRWNNVQENAFILLAMNTYFATFEAEDPDFVARIWLGDLYVAEHEYRGRTTTSNETGVTTSDLIEAGDAPLVVSKQGDGRLYYRLGLRYAPEDLTLDPLDRGFVVQRTYESADSERPDDVTLNSDGSWTVKAGAEVRVRLTMVADSRRTHVALVDPLPAGFESVNPALAISAVPVDENPAQDVTTRWWWGRWFDHQNLRSDRTEAFATLLRAGTYEYSYVARATTPGTFVVPPTKAEEMYHPETFGRGSSGTVTIVDS